VHNSGLPRTALKMATGSGKTVVVAMLIAWQTLNHAHSPRDARFTNRFLVVTRALPSGTGCGCCCPATRRTTAIRASRCRPPQGDALERLAESLGVTVPFLKHAGRARGGMAMDAHMRRRSTAPPSTWR